MYRGMRLRTKFLLSLLAISSGLTAATLFVVSYSVERRVRESLRDELRNSVKIYETFDQQREAALSQSAKLVANLPIVRALMTTEDAATIQDGSESIWKLSGGEILILGNRSGEVLGLQSKSKGLTREEAQELVRGAVQRNEARNWWYVKGHLYQVWLQPIYFGAVGQGTVIGILGVGYEIGTNAAHDFSNVVSSEIVFECGDAIVASTLPAEEQRGLLATSKAATAAASASPQELQIGSERYLGMTLSLTSIGEIPVSLVVLKSLDKATEFLNRLNRILLGLGLISVFAGGALVFLISHTFTKPLSNLVAGVRALAEGNYEYPLDKSGGDEVGEVAGAFDGMRTNMRATLAEQKQLEDRLRQAHKMEAVGRLAGGVAHDFNNLLTVIRGNSDLLLDRGDADQSQVKYLGQIQKAADRAVSMTRQLLAFSRMQVLQPRLLDLNTTISEMNKMIPRLIGEHIQFSFTPELNLGTILADPGQVEQVFLNLAVNARDAMPNGGELTVRTSNVAIDENEARKRPPMSPGEYVLLAVSDTGHGMDAETKARIFEPFFTTKEVGKGTGLGLATVYGVVKQSGGFIWVDSAPGKGATFEIYLPRSAKPAVTTEVAGIVGPFTGGKETIIVVEDETGVRELASEFLKAGGYLVLEASDGAEALKIATNHKGSIDLLLTDIVMPRMNGIDLAQRVRETLPGVRVAFMTGYTEFSDKNGQNVLIDASILQKPFSRSTLLEQVRNILNTAPRRSADESKVG